MLSVIKILLLTSVTQCGILIHFPSLSDLKQSGHFVASLFHSSGKQICMYKLFLYGLFQFVCTDFFEFCTDFSQFYTDFSQFCTDFSQFCTDFSQFCTNFLEFILTYCVLSILLTFVKFTDFYCFFLFFVCTTYYWFLPSLQP